MDALSLIPLVFYIAAVLVLVTLLTAISVWLGPRHRPNKATDAPFESGIVEIGAAHSRFPAKFYLIAMFFVIFDLEAVYLFAWAIAVRGAGWAGFIEALIFVIVLLAALAYLWRVGALEWGPASKPHRRVDNAVEPETRGGQTRGAATERQL